MTGSVHAEQPAALQALTWNGTVLGALLISITQLISLDVMQLAGPVTSKPVEMPASP